MKTLAFMLIASGNWLGLEGGDGSLGNIDLSVGQSIEFSVRMANAAENSKLYSKLTLAWDIPTGVAVLNRARCTLGPHTQVALWNSEHPGYSRLYLVWNPPAPARLPRDFGLVSLFPVKSGAIDWEWATNASGNPVGCMAYDQNGTWTREAYELRYRDRVSIAEAQKAAGQARTAETTPEEAPADPKASSLQASVENLLVEYERIHRERESLATEPSATERVRTGARAVE